jgi:hypothetical protein
MARKTERQPPSGLWSSEHLQAWKRMHPGRDEKVADALSGMLIRNKLKFDFYEFTVLHFIRSQLGWMNFRPAFTVLVKLFRKEDGTLNQIVLNPHLFYCLLSAMACWLERPVVGQWVEALKDLDEGDFRIGLGAATVEGTETLREIKEKWNAEQNGNQRKAGNGTSEGKRTPKRD